uniref:Signal transducer and activator of transcription n=1 Tax=Chelonoidis abingdonii TaxID=106734 RepID=A0A8C0GDW9_CHEAB
MAQWQEVQQLEKVYLEQVHRLYSEDHLPMEVRQYLAPWLEDQNWNRAAEPPAAEPRSSQAHMLFHTLLALLDDQYSRFGASENDFVLKHNLRKAKLNLQVGAGCWGAGAGVGWGAVLTPLTHPAPVLSSRPSTRTGCPEWLRLPMASHCAPAKLAGAGRAALPPPPVGRLGSQKQCLWQDVLARAQELLGRCETLRDFLLEELAEWKDRQRRACIGAACDTSLSRLETWFTGAAEVLFQLWRLLRALGEQHVKLTYLHDPLAAQRPLLESRLQEQLSCLLRSAFVVEIQPIMPFPNRRPLVLKTGSKFSVRPGRPHGPTPLASSRRFRKFNILTSTSKTLVQDDPQMEGLVCDFRHIVRARRGRGLLAVTEELHLITFTLDYKYQELALELQTSTLPVVIISSNNQFSSAWASMLWFNMLSPDPKNQLFFSAPPAASWAQLAEVLSWQFSAATERGLDKEQLHMLAEKLFGNGSGGSDNPPTFSFWTWLDGILNLIRDHLAQLWKDGHIMGFVSRKWERQLLKRKQMGTFLLRFSESTREGGITCSWVEPGEKGQPKVRSVEPYTKMELTSLPLPDIIHDYQLVAAENIPENPLKFLYPGTPRDEAFGKYYTERREVDLLEQRKYLNRRCPTVAGALQGDSQLHSLPSLVRATQRFESPPLHHPSEQLQLALGLGLGGCPIPESILSSATDPLSQAPSLPRQPHEPWLPENMVAAPPAAEGLAANHLEALEPGANRLEVLEPGASHLEPLELGANHVEALEPGACGLEALGLGTYELESLEAGANHLEALEPGAYGLEALELGAYGLEALEPGPSHLEALEPGASTQEMLEALKQELDLMSFDRAGESPVPAPGDGEGAWHQEGGGSKEAKPLRPALGVPLAPDPQPLLSQPPLCPFSPGPVPPPGSPEPSSLSLAGSNALRGRDPYLPPPGDAPPAVLPGSTLFLGANDLPPLHVDSKDFQ